MGEMAWARSGSTRKRMALAMRRLSVLTMDSGRTSPGLWKPIPLAWCAIFLGMKTAIASLKGVFPCSSAGKALSMETKPLSRESWPAASNSTLAARGPSRCQAA